MRSLLLLPVLASMALAQAPDFDPAASATGWAHCDRDGSCTFLDSAGKRLVNWMRDGTVLSQVSLAKLDFTPEMWVLDSYNNAWVTAGGVLQFVEKSGKPGTRIKLPAEVADLAWDTKGMVLSFRTPTPYLEKREFKGGGLIWSWGSKPGDERSGNPELFRVMIADSGEVVVSRGASMMVDLLDPVKGKPVAQAAMLYKDAPMPDLILGNGKRGAAAWWIGKPVGFSALTGAQAPFAKMSGMLLARLDFSEGRADVLPTGLTEDHAFIGMMENDAVFIAPKGGLVFVAVR